MKSPNMISTTGRIPVMAAPTPIPLMPASEIGESITRWVPNSPTSPDNTLNGVPASATSSPMINTVGSRRISSDSASLIAWLNVISRPGLLVVMMVACDGFPTFFPSAHRRGDAAGILGVDMLVYLVGRGKRSRQSEVHRADDLFRNFVIDCL